LGVVESLDFHLYMFSPKPFIGAVVISNVLPPVLKIPRDHTGLGLVDKTRFRRLREHDLWVPPVS
jgi:hypothetical protein